MVKISTLAYLEHGHDVHPEFAALYNELLRSHRRRLNALDRNSSAEAGYRPEKLSDGGLLFWRGGCHAARPRLYRFRKSK